jgi:hypothetical protein
MDPARPEPRRVILTWCIAAVWTVMWLATAGPDDTLTDRMLGAGATWRGTAWNGEWWRLFTAGFVQHPGNWTPWNLLMGVLWLREFEREQPRTRMLIVMLSASALSAATTVLLSDRLFAGNDSHVWAVIGGLFAGRVHQLGLNKFLTVRRHAIQCASVVVWLVAMVALAPESLGFVVLPALSGAALTGSLLSARRWPLAVTAVSHVVVVALSLFPLTEANRTWWREHEVATAFHRHESQRVLELAPTMSNPVLAEYRVAAMYELGRGDEANDELRACVKTTPADFTCRTLLIRELRARNQLREALRLTEGFVTLEQDRLEILSGLGWRNEARRLFQSATTLTVEQRRVHRCAFALDDGDLSAVRTRCADVKDTDVWWARSLRAHALVLFDQCADAEALLPDRRSLFERKLLAVCAIRRGDAGAARELIGPSPGDPELQLLEFALAKRSEPDAGLSDARVSLFSNSTLIPLLSPDVQALFRRRDE